MLDETGSSHQEDVDDRPDVPATFHAPDSLDSELLCLGERGTLRAATLQLLDACTDSRSGMSG